MDLQRSFQGSSVKLLAEAPAALSAWTQDAAILTNHSL